VGFTSGSSYWNSSAQDRVNEGYKKAKLFHKMVTEGKIKLSKNETIKVISHSQGGAHAAGFAEKLMSYNLYGNGCSIVLITVLPSLSRKYHRSA
jgi:hypothetical protein